MGCRLGCGMPAAARNKGPLFAGARPAPPPPRSAPRRKVRCFLAALETAPCSPASTGKAHSATGAHQAGTAPVPSPPPPRAPGHRHRKAHSSTRDKGARPLGGPARRGGCHLCAGVCARGVTRVRGGVRITCRVPVCAAGVMCVRQRSCVCRCQHMHQPAHVCRRVGTRRHVCVCAGARALGVICVQVCVYHVLCVCRSWCVHRLGTCIWHTCVPVCVHQVSRVCRCQHVHWLSRVCRCLCTGCHTCEGCAGTGVHRSGVHVCAHRAGGVCVRARARGPCAWGCCARVGVCTPLHTRVHGAVVHGSSRGCAMNPACAPQL
ncbi:uncharacterized protein ACIBXB_019657 [Morphnus guianensis]